MIPKNIRSMVEIRVIILSSLYILASLFYLPFIIQHKIYILSVIPIIGLVTGLGVLCRKNWARIMLLVTNIPVNILSAFLTLSSRSPFGVTFPSDRFNVVLNLVQFILSIVFILLAFLIQIYFIAPAIKNFFNST
jgi:hypothetical protein